MLTTASTPSRRGRQTDGSKSRAKSTVTASRAAGSRCTAAMTRCPADRNAAPRCSPMKPLAPVRNTTTNAPGLVRYAVARASGRSRHGHFLCLLTGFSPSRTRHDRFDGTPGVARWDAQRSRARWRHWCRRSRSAFSAVERRAPLLHRSTRSAIGISATARRARTALSLKYTLSGYLTHHAASVFWATLFERLFERRTWPRPAAPLVPAAAVAAIAAVVDYTITPKRLTPGYEKRLSIPALVVVYTAFAAGLALGRGGRALLR